MELRWRALRRQLEDGGTDPGTLGALVAAIEEIADAPVRELASWSPLPALQRAQADTVVLSDDPSSPLRAWIGPEPLQVAEPAEDLAAMGVSEPRQDRYDSALLRAVAGSEADLMITPNAHEYVQDGIGALLRYADEATPPG